MRKFSNVLGIKVDCLTTNGILSKLEEFIAEGRPHQIIYLNADGVNRCFFDKRYRSIIEKADLVYPDGMSVVLASRFSNYPLPERINAGDFLPQLCQLCLKKEYKLFFLGGEEKVAERAAKNLKKAFMHLQIVGIQDGFFQDTEEDEIIKRINSSGADILLVGMGCPRQEKWIKKNMHRLNIPVLWGVGGLFDYYSLRIKRAPGFLRKIGLEWLFRLILEPRRLWKRYILGNALFLLRLFAILLFDASLISLSWIGTWWLRDKLNFLFPKTINPIQPYIRGLPILITAWMLVCVYFGLYRREHSLWLVKELSSIFKAVLIGMLIAMALAFLFKEYSFGRSVIIISGITNFFLLSFSHFLFYKLDLILIKKGYVLRKVLIVGKGRLARMVKEEIEDSPLGYEVMGFIDDTKDDSNLQGLNIIGKVSDLEEIIENQGIEEIFVATERPLTDELNFLAQQKKTNIRFKLISGSLIEFADRVGTEKIKDVPLVDLTELSPKRVYEIFKRIFDIVFSAIGILLFLPLGLIIAVLVKLESQGPVLFFHRRVDKDERTFLMLKFRTMYKDVKKYETAPKHKDDPRITKVGRFLRRLSLDELPQLINVFLGQMSFVGPRPEMRFIVRKYQPWQRQRLSVRPGITGLWQVMGRKDLPLDRNLEYDFYYIKHKSIFLDLAILIKTIPAVIFRKGAY